MGEKIITVYELRGIGDDVNFLEHEAGLMCKEIAHYLAENVPAPGDIIEIVSKRMFESDFKRLAD